MSVLLTIVSPYAAAQPATPTAATIYPKLALPENETVLSGEMGCAEVIGDDKPCAGFRPFLRLGLGGYESLEINEYSIDSGFDSITPEEPEFLADGFVPRGSVEIMGQHLWQNGQLVNAAPKLRLGVAAAGIDVQGGWLPLPDRGVGESRPGANPVWRAANYLAYGVGTEGILMENLLEYQVSFTVDDVGATGGEPAAYTSFPVGDPNVLTSRWDSEVEQIIVGPKLRFGRVASYGNWLFDANVSVLFGYGRSEFEQEFELQGAGLSRRSPPNSLTNREQTSTEYFAAESEFELSANYFLSRHWAVGLSGTIGFLSPVDLPAMPRFESISSSNFFTPSERDKFALTYSVGGNLAFVW